MDKDTLEAIRISKEALEFIDATYFKDQIKYYDKIIKDNEERLKEKYEKS